MGNDRMSKLTDELKIEHNAITETLQEVNRLGIWSKEGQDMLMAAKNCLLAHLEKEDEHMYPLLRNAAEGDTDLRQTLDFYAANMDEISKVALDFFEKYSSGGSGIEFGKDFGELYTTLSLRIAKEEAAIYKKFDDLKPLT